VSDPVPVALYSSGLPPTPAALIGVDTATLQLWLGQAQAALQQIMIGGSPQTVTYGQGDGQKSVTYGRANEGQLIAWISQLQQALGLFCGRRAIPVRFSR
jgi:hypothetical protein